MNWWTNLSSIIAPRFEIFGFQIYYYGIIIGLASLLGIWIAQKKAKFYGVNKDNVESIVLWAFIPGLIGARLYHVLDNFSYYLLHPFDIVAIWKGGLGIYGALIGGIIGLIYLEIFSGSK